MKTLGVFEAKTRFSALVVDAMAGKATIVTKNGKPVAEVGPVHSERIERRAQAVARIRALRKQLNLAGLNIRELINEDRDL